MPTGSSRPDLKGEIMETLLLARAKYLLDRVSNNVKYRTLDGSPALPAEAAALIECLGKLRLVEDADAMRKDFIVYFAHEVRLPNTGLDPRLVEFRSTANELFGPFLKYTLPRGDLKVVRLRLIDHFDGLRITFKKLSTLSSPLTPPAPETGADEGKAGSTTRAKQADEPAGGGEATPQEADREGKRAKPVGKAGGEKHSGDYHGLVQDLMIAACAPGDSTTRIKAWPAISHLLRSKFGDLPPSELWNRLRGWLEAEGLKAQEYLVWSQDDLLAWLKSKKDGGQPAAGGPVNAREFHAQPADPDREDNIRVKDLRAWLERSWRERGDTFLGVAPTTPSDPAGSAVNEGEQAKPAGGGDKQQIKNRKRSGRTIAPKRPWTQPELDDEIRKYKANRASNFGELVANVEKGLRGAKKAARDMFGRNAIVDVLGVKSPAMVSNSTVWRNEIAVPLRLEKKQPKRGKKIGAAIALEEASIQAGDTTVQDVFRRETIARIRKHLPEEAAQGLIEKLESGTTDYETADKTIDLYLKQDKDRRSRKVLDSG